jgi:acyl-coenzyme A thioesterase PaaI-like protein
MAVDPASGDARTPAPADFADFANFTASMGLELWHEGERTHGRVEVRREFMAPGTDRVRVGVLATLVDTVSGTLPTGPINPTIDLRFRLLDEPPSSGAIHLVSHPVKAGKRLFLGEVFLHAGDPSRPFATSTITFINQTIPGFAGGGAGDGRVQPVARPLGAASYDDALAPRFPNATTVEIDPQPHVSNPIFGTFLGGAQVLLAEIAAEHALSDSGVYRTVDLDIRFVNRSGSETVTATAEPVSGPLDEHSVRVVIRRGSDARLVSLAAVRCLTV